MKTKYEKLSREELVDRVNAFEQELKGYVDRIDQRYKVFFERNLAGIYRSKLNGQIVECNDALATILGYESKEELIGSDARMLYQDQKDRERHIHLLTEKGFVKNRRLALQKKNGDKIWVSISTSQIENPKTAEIEFMEGTIIDITELILTQELLEMNEQNYKNMLDQSPYGIVIIEGDELVYFNVRAREILKTPLKSGQNVKKIFPERFFSEFVTKIGGDGIKHFDRVGFKTKKKEVFLDVYLKPILFENRQMMEVSFVDIRERIELEEERIRSEVFEKLNNQLKAEISKKERIERELKKSLVLNEKQAAKLEAIFENKSHIIWTLDAQYRFTSFNSNLAELFLTLYNRTPKHQDNPFTDFRGLQKKEAVIWRQAHEKAFKGELVNFTTEMKADRNKTTFYEVFLNPIFNEKKEVEEVSGIGHDITEKTLAEIRLTESLKEKDILLKEVHHRVKNNLQVISSIFNLQSAYNQEDAVRDVLKESQNRIKSMAYIHESLYKSSQFGRIDFEEYLRKLCKNLIQSYTLRTNQISLLTETEKVLIHLDQAIPCGLMVNEVISNSLKHAFPDKSHGIVAIDLKKRGNILILKISDDGVGIPESVLKGESHTLGFQLINTLVEQLRGKVDIQNEVGTTFNFSFKLQG
ncbi:MAG: histidine kinase dimerization/phosphoacceptor domain -containing protein [Vicingaceae bacterium]